MALTEAQVQNALVPYLQSIRYDIKKLKSGKEHGPDITARHERYSRAFVIEVKGDPGARVRSPASSRENAFLVALGQIITRIKPATGYYYGLAFPSSYKTTALRRVDWSVYKYLRLRLFFVNSKREVEEVTWREVKDVQGKLLR